jgi:hypothetical protein
MRILYITFNAPPVKNVASFRTEAYLKYFPAEGMEVDVLTRHYVDYESIGTDFDVMKSDAIEHSAEGQEGPVYYTGFYNYVSHTPFYRKTRGLARVITNIYLVDAHYYGWKKIALDFFEKHLSRKCYDLIIATYNPLITFVVAQVISRRYNILWIAEYRDSFVTDVDRGQTLLYKKIVQYRALRGVSSIVVVSEGIVHQLKKSLTGPQCNLDIVLIRNGYDDTVQPNVEVGDQTIWDVFRQLRRNYRTILLHTGTIYERQNWHYFLDCVRRYNEDSEEKVALVLVGLNKDGMSVNPLLQRDVYILPKIANTTSLFMQQEADALILPAWYTDRYTGFIAKVFEYLWFGKRVWCSPAPPLDLRNFISGFSHVVILDNYQAFESAVREAQKNSEAQGGRLMDKRILTRRYWMHQLVLHIRQKSSVSNK